MAESFERLARCKHHLHVLKSSLPAVQKVLLQKADSDLILSIAEIAKNILNGNLALTRQSRENLRRFKTTLRHLAAPVKSAARKKLVTKQSGRGKAARRAASVKHETGVSTAAAAWKTKRRYLVQKGTGAFLTSLLSTALGATVGRLISSGVSKWQSNNHDTASGTQ